MKKILLSLLYPLAAVSCCLAQTANTISGTVTDAANDNPIPACSVFINGSSRGTITDGKGVFVLAHIPAGNYDLVVSAIGYETYALSFSDSRLPMELKIKLKQRVSELSSFTVEPYDKDGWQKWGLFFVQSFLGTGENAAQCTLRNKEALRFRFSKRRDLLTVTATEPLIIENKALGYRLRYQLESFTYNGGTHVLFFLGYPFFTEMTGSQRKLRAWVRSRRNAYLGSMMQFMHDLYCDSLQQAGFSITQLVSEPNLEKQRVKICYEAARKIPAPMQSDTLAYYLRILHQDDFLRHEVFLKTNTLLSNTAGQDKTLFFRGQLKVDYTNREGAAFDRQSVIWLQTPAPVQLWENGSYYPPQEVFSSGYWSHSEKVSNMLPLDYDIP